METIHITASSVDATQLEAIKTILKALKIKFSLKKEKESSYDPDFVAMIRQGEEDLKNGKGIKITMEAFEALCK
jgi:hypothetical protein